MSGPQTLATTFGFAMGVMLALWLVSLVKRNASIVDAYWGPGFACIAWVAWAATHAEAGPRAWLVLALVTLWGVRLGGYLLWRNWGQGEDPRYQAMRRHHGDRFPIVSLFTVFGLQGVLMWIISLPVQAAVISPGPRGLGALDIAGALLWAVGIFFEAVGDWQLARFKADPANAGQVMDRGLWRYTRHPNYFGDCCVWWGIFLVAAATPYGWWTLPSPVIMSVLLMQVSGVPLLERSLAKRRPGYEAYRRRTSAFVPWPPRRA